VAAFERQIDELYKLPLGEFTAARNALARTLGGDDAARVKRLAKPTVVPWAVNQVYWHDRSVFDRLRKAGERLRVAQIAALKGRAADVRGAGDAHRRALAEACSRALNLASSAGARADPDELTRTLEALSLAPELPEPAGRLTRALQPAGFEALADMTSAAGRYVAPAPRGGRTSARQEPAARTAAAPGAGVESGRSSVARRAEAEAARQVEAETRRAEAERLRAEAELKRAEAAFDRAGAAETRARLVWEGTKREREEAERTLTRARETLADRIGKLKRQ
jgi:hypothetical protein